MPDTLKKNHSRSHWYRSAMKGISFFLKSGKYSIAFISIIAVLLIFVGQGGMLFVDLLDHNVLNLILFFIIGHAFSLILTHYPSYLRMWYQSSGDLDSSISKEGESWHMPIEVLGTGLGMITYKESPAVQGSYVNRVRRWADAFRGLLGACYHIAFIYVSITLSNKYLADRDVQGVTDYFIHPAIGWGVVVAALILYVWLSYLKVATEKDQLNEAYTHVGNMTNDMRVDKMYKWRNIFVSLFWICIALTLVTIINSSKFGWSGPTAWSFFLTEVMCLFAFVIFRFVRSKFEYSDVWAFPFNLLHNHLYYILFITTLGWLSLIIILFAHYEYGSLSPVVLIIAIFNVAYGLLIIPTKHFFFYSYKKGQGEVKMPWHKRMFSFIFRYAVPMASVLLIITLLFMNMGGNGLHKVRTTVYSASDEVGETEYHQYVKDHVSAIPTDEPIYFISSYGGGLMANYWNLLILDHLDQLSIYREDSRSNSTKSVMDNTIAMSGVSGGALGQAFYLGLYGLPDSVRTERIAAMGRSNPLTLDLAYSFGYDLLREPLVGVDQFEHQDRAGRVMREYANEQGDTALFEQSFRGYWKQRFEQASSASFFPLLLSNSTGLRNTRGLACSIAMDSFQVVFPNSEDILAPYDGKTPTYLGAVSCSNRFPILSPAARVPGHGHFLDGGYFENSGLLSLSDLYVHIRPLIDNDDRPVIFIQVLNSKSAYIRKILKEADLSHLMYEENETSETAAVLGALAGVDNLPRYLEGRARNGEVQYAQIHLPYEVCKADVDALYQGKVHWNEELDSLFTFHNERLYGTLFPTDDRSEVCVPELARLLTDKTNLYMQRVVGAYWFLDEVSSSLQSAKHASKQIQHMQKRQKQRAISSE